jgi:hypothetical protein
VTPCSRITGRPPDVVTGNGPSLRPERTPTRRRRHRARGTTVLHGSRSSRLARNWSDTERAEEGIARYEGGTSSRSLIDRGRRYDSPCGLSILSEGAVPVLARPSSPNGVSERNSNVFPNDAFSQGNRQPARRAAIYWRDVKGGYATLVAYPPSAAGGEACPARRISSQRGPAAE